MATFIVYVLSTYLGCSEAGRLRVFLFAVRRGCRLPLQDLGCAQGKPLMSWKSWVMVQQVFMSILNPKLMLAACSRVSINWLYTSDEFSKLIVSLRQETDVPELDHLCGRAWNAGSALEMHEWLQVQQPEGFKDRIKTLGNIVVPAQACLAVSVFVRVIQSNFGTLLS